MIPKKLYIPTSTLNFNNIMSSESISPASFYAIRGYGYRSIEKVCANNFDNRILLYEYYPIYQIEDVERDNYPLVIEIDTSQLGDGVILENAGLYYSEQTIYFNALTTVFIFHDKGGINTVLNKSKQSIETKLVNLYEHNFTTIQACSATKYEWRKNNQIDDINTNKDKYVELDRRIDRLKGFLYAHFLGVEKSSSVEIIKLRNLSRQLYNTWSAVISSSYNTPSVKQKNELEELYRKIKFLTTVIIGVDKKIADIFQKELSIDESMSKNIVNIFKKYGRYDIGGFFGIESFRFQPLSLYGIDVDEKMSSLSKHIAELDNFTAIQSQTKIKNTTDDLPEVSNLQICQYGGKSKEQSEFLINMFNTILNESSKYSLIQDRYTFARMGGELFKNKIIDRWEGSQEKAYINGLLKNLKNHAQFEVSNSNNTTLKSFATFCQVANDDIEKLENNLIKNEITDYKIAFGLWGIVFGFAGISKTTYNEISDRCGESFFIQLYKHIYTELHEIKLEGDIPNYITIESKINQRKEDNITCNHVSDDGEILNKTTQSLEPIHQRKLNNSPRDLRTDNTSIAVDIEVRQRLETAIKNGTKADAKKGDSIMAKLSTNSGNWQSIIENIESDDKLKLGKKTIKSICSVFNISMSQSSKSKVIKNKNTIEEPSLFQCAPLLFYCDKNAYDLIVSILNKGDEEKQFKTDLKYLQTEYASGGKYSSKSKGNNNVINHFEQLLWQGKNGSEKIDWKREAYKKLDIDRIISKLRSHYEG